MRRSPEHERNSVGRVEIRAALLFGATGGAVLLLSVSPYLNELAELYLWVHMIQHLIITLVAAPLLVLALALYLSRAQGPPASTPGLNAPDLVVAGPYTADPCEISGWLGRLLGSRPLRVLLHPVVTWVVFAVVMWAAHLSPLYQAALESTPLHAAEHLLFLGAGLLFWAPVMGVRPGAPALAWPARIGYVIAALPQQSFLALILYSSKTLLYPHYAATDWPDGPLADQRLGATIMWLGGDALLLVALLVLIAAWMRAEQRLEVAESRV